MMIEADITTEMGDQSPETFAASLANDVVQHRRRPLLLLFYLDETSIDEPNLEHLSLLLRGSGLTREKPLANLDVLIQTVGGDPITAYRLAQLIRDYAEGVEFLVPEYAYSGGTLLCLAGDEILLGGSAVLSPFDIKLVRGQRTEAEEEMYEDEAPEAEVETVAIDHFIQVAKQARIEIERGFRQRGWRSSRTEVESAMLCEMVRQVGSLTIAGFYREKNLTEAYANELLSSYMLAGRAVRPRIVKILKHLIFEAPSHGFPMDYHLCLDAGLRVAEMEEPLSDLTQRLSNRLGRLGGDDSLFPRLRGDRLPLFRVYPYTEAPMTEEVASQEDGRVPQEASDGERQEDESRAVQERAEG